METIAHGNSNTRALETAL